MNRTLTITDTPGLLALIRDNLYPPTRAQRPRQGSWPEPKNPRAQGPILALVRELDLTGLHVVCGPLGNGPLLHNDYEYRCSWLVKLDGRMEPGRVTMDNDCLLWDRITAKVVVSDDASAEERRELCLAALEARGT